MKKIIKVLNEKIKYRIKKRNRVKILFKEKNVIFGKINDLIFKTQITVI